MGAIPLPVKAAGEKGIFPAVLESWHLFAALFLQTDALLAQAALV